MTETTSRDLLKEIVAKTGDGLLQDPDRCEGLLKDYRVGSRREISAIVGALEERVPLELKSSWQTAMTPEAMRSRLVQRLEENRGLAPEVANWAVDAWSYALGVPMPTGSNVRLSPSRKAEDGPPVPSESSGREESKEHELEKEKMQDDRAPSARMWLICAASLVLVAVGGIWAVHAGRSQHPHVGAAKSQPVQPLPQQDQPHRDQRQPGSDPVDRQRHQTSAAKDGPPQGDSRGDAFPPLGNSDSALPSSGSGKADSGRRAGSGESQAQGHSRQAAGTGRIGSGTQSNENGESSSQSARVTRNGSGSAQQAGSSAITTTSIPANTVIAIRLNDGVNSAELSPGDILSASVSSPVRVGGQTVIPMGSDALVRVSSIEQSSGEQARTSVRLELFQVAGTGGAIGLLTTAKEFVGPTRARDQAERGAIGGAAGAVAGFVTGHILHHGGTGAAIGGGGGAAVGAMTSKVQPVKLPAEQLIRFVTIQSAHIPAPVATAHRSSDAQTEDN